MPDSPIISTTTALEWTQLSLLPYEVVEIDLRIGVVPESDHLQWQITVRDPAAGALLGMLSSPAVSASQWRRQLAAITSALEQIYENHVSPF